MMGMPLYEPLAAVILALLVAVLAVRALGETDLNPVSGVGKLSQVRLLLQFVLTVYAAYEDQGIVPLNGASGLLP